MLYGPRLSFCLEAVQIPILEPDPPSQTVCVRPFVDAGGDMTDWQVDE